MNSRRRQLNKSTPVRESVSEREIEDGARDREWGER